MTKKEIVKTIKENFRGVQKIVQKRSGEIILMKGFFYRTNNSLKTYEKQIQDQFNEFNIKNIEIIESYENYTSFNGNASVDKQSHFGVIFKVVE